MQKYGSKNVDLWFYKSRSIVLKMQYKRYKTQTQ